MTLSVAKLTPSIGAEISGVDLAALSNAHASALHDALMAHPVIFFPDQKMTPEQHKRLCEGLTALHTSAHVFSKNAYGRSDKSFPEAVHPVVRTHPVTGRKALFVNRGFTTRIMELRKHESDALLAMLVRHAETPEFQCRFRWAANSVAFWDNRCALHLATFDYHPAVRHGHRVTIKGDTPFYRA